MNIPIPIMGILFVYARNPFDVILDDVVFGKKALRNIVFTHFVIFGIVPFLSPVPLRSWLYGQFNNLSHSFVILLVLP